jgi:hypothetical protein
MSQPAETTIAQTFPYFSDPRFPAEIKDLIWLFAINTIPPRTVEITGNPKSPLGVHSWIPTAPLPALLHTCSRSRHLTQQHYPLSFSSSQTTFSNGIYFNFQKDTLYFGKEFNFTVDFIQEVGKEERGKVKRLAFGLEQQTELSQGGFLMTEDEDGYEEVKDVVEALFDSWPGVESVGFVDQVTGYLQEIGGENENEGRQDDDEGEEGDEGEEEEEGEEIDIEAWKWYPKEYIVLVNGSYEVGGMLEEALLGNFEKRCKQSGFKIPEMRFLEVRKVARKQVGGE